MLESDDLDPEDRDLLARPINLAKVLAHSPDGARAFSRLGGWIRFKSQLDPRLREMAILRIGVLEQNEYEFSHHVKLGLEFGLDDADIGAVIDGPDAAHLNPLERLVVQAADEATRQGAIAETTLDELRIHLSDRLVLELTIVIAFYNGVVRLLASLGVDVEEDYLHWLERHPLPAPVEGET